MTTEISNPAEASAVVWVRGSMPAAVVGVLLIAAFWPILQSMAGSWFDEHFYMEHGVLAIPAAACMVASQWQKLVRVPRAPSYWAVPLLLWGAAQAIVGLAAHWVWVSRTAFLVSLAGCVEALYGVRIVRELAYPLGTLFLMIAPPTFLYERLTLDLQLLASRWGAAFLEAAGYPVLVEGNVLELLGGKLSVEEACSGIRSLISILFVCVVYNYFFVRGNSLRTFILLMAVPITILGNIGRIVAIGIAGQHHLDLAHGMVHDAFGYLSVAVAGIGCVVLHVTMVHLQKAWRSHGA